MSRYAALARYLETVSEDVVTLSFGEIESILGFPLPPSARKHGAWWSNGASNAAWITVGWKSEGRDMAGQRVTFRRGASTTMSAPKVSSVRPSRAAITFDVSTLTTSDFAENVDVTVRMSWRRLGDITLTETGGLAFPAAPTEPGLYRLIVRRGSRLQAYVGEATVLRDRFRNYRIPGHTQKTSVRINAELRSALSAGISVSLDVAFQDVALVISGVEVPADLGNKAIRRLAEQAAIVAHGGIDVDMLNL